MTDETESTSGLPTVRLRPKAEARAIRHGFPWIYADELVLDRRTSGLVPGTFARLEDAGPAVPGACYSEPRLENRGPGHGP